ncbi:glutamine-hydrolyzing GMP synthase, partial [Candidatus Bipolaricaulota bacterium]|nr:glutamine-hydrolyzing GMP synthase [Candidatus Bipolaricaulota bacterium]
MDTIAVLDFGGQYSHLIGRRIREQGIYAKILSSDTTSEELGQIEDLRGIILSGGAASVYSDQSPKPDPKILEMGLPVLGICYGHQLIAQLSGGEVEAGEVGEFGTTALNVKDENSELLSGLDTKEEVWMNHKDRVTDMPPQFDILASTESSPIAVFVDNSQKLYGVQFHPEVILP